MIKRFKTMFLPLLTMLIIVGISCTLPQGTISKSKNESSKNINFDQKLTRSEVPTDATTKENYRIGPFIIRTAKATQTETTIGYYPTSDNWGIISDMQTYNGSDTSHINIYKTVSGNKYYYIGNIEEEKSKDSEMNHAEEIIASFQMRPGLIVDKYNNVIGETGMIDIDKNASKHTFDRISYSRTYSNPVVFASVISNNGVDPCHTRIKSVTRTTFDVKIEEWHYLDVSHTTETICYMVLEKGTHQMGKEHYLNESEYEFILEVDSFNMSQSGHNFTHRKFNNDFTGGDPILMSATQTYNGTAPIVTRVKNITADGFIFDRGGNPSYNDGFDIRMQEEEAEDQDHPEETVAYLALGPANGPSSNIVSIHRGLRVINGQLCNYLGNPVYLKGMSLFWTNWMVAEGHPELNNFANESVVNWLVDDWDIDVLRIPIGVDPHNMDGERIDLSGYIFHKEEQFEMLKQLVVTCVHKGIYVIIDWHIHDAYMHIAEAREFFETVAGFGEYDNVIYEIWNEPSIENNNINGIGWNNSYTWAEIAPYHNDIIQIIRYNTFAKDNIIILGTPRMSGKLSYLINQDHLINGNPYNDIDLSNLSDNGNILYTFHFYAGSHGVPNLDANNNLIPPHNELVYDYYYGAVEYNLPVFATEWGTSRSDGGSDGAVYLDDSLDWIRAFYNYKTSWCNWSICDKEEAASALRFGANTLGGWKDSDLTESGIFIRDKIRSIYY